MKKYSKSFKGRLHIFFIISIVIPIVILAFVFSWKYNQQLKKENQLNVSNTIAAVGGNIEVQLKDLEKITFTPYLYKDILNTLIYFKNGFFENTPSYIDIISSENNYVMTFSKILFTSSRHINTICFQPNSNEEYVYVISRNKAGLQTIPLNEYPNVVDLDSMTDSRYSYINYTVSDPLYRNEPTFTYSRRIIDPDSKKEIGVIHLNNYADHLLEALDQVQLKDNSQLLLVDNNGNILCNKGNLSAENLNQIDFSLAEDGEYIINKTKIENSPWSLVYLTNKRDLFDVQTTTFFLAFILSAVVISLSFYIYKQQGDEIVRSVDEILNTLTLLQSGNFNTSLKVDSNDELNAIAEGVNHMALKMDEHIKKEYIATIKSQEAEYRALQSQINPHFLYNILNDFVGLNRMGESELLERSIIRLTVLFRYTCTPRNTTTVEDELKFCEEYLELRKLQLEDRLDFTLSIEDSVRTKEIPKLILQPLVENCVQHGYSNKIESLQINISAYIEGQSLILLVKDNGAGFDEAVLQQSNRVGIANISERLKLFHKGSTLKIDSSVNLGTTCTIEIPLPEEAVRGELS